MTVRQWKRVITFVVVALIVSLAVALIVVAVKAEKLDDILSENEEIIAFLNDAEKSGIITSEDIAEMSKEINAKQGQEKPEYESKYSKLYVDNDFVYDEDSEGAKKVYLTFDDGPSTENTEKILKILDKYDVKATFFVIYHKSDEMDELLKKIADAGHTIGVHSASHNYNKIYSSVDAYLKDFNKLAKHIEEVTGEMPEIYRFPGGSVNSYNGAVYEQIIAEMTRRGFTYYDWDVSSGDASYGTASASWITKNVVNGVKTSKKNIVLMHDTNAKDTTVEALPGIIESLQKKGYTFEKLTKEVKPVVFGYLS
jgi:peptidoglycan-N-acetylglucosamine deacetylase